MTPTLETIRRCFEGAIPAQVDTCAPDGTPNVAYLSQVHYVDSNHVALSFQFFSKSRENVLANPYAMAQVIDPATGAQYHLTLQYLRTETEGPLFEYMKARLILLQRRLAERCPYLRIDKTGRGRFRLAVERPASLVEGR